MIVDDIYAFQSFDCRPTSIARGDIRSEEEEDISPPGTKHSGPLGTLER